VGAARVAGQGTPWPRPAGPSPVGAPRPPTPPLAAPCIASTCACTCKRGLHGCAELRALRLSLSDKHAGAIACQMCAPTPCAQGDIEAVAAKSPQGLTQLFEQISGSEALAARCAACSARRVELHPSSDGAGAVSGPLSGAPACTGRHDGDTECTVNCGAHPPDCWAGGGGRTPVGRVPGACRVLLLRPAQCADVHQRAPAPALTPRATLPYCLAAPP
jgi:hypothetical protein